ncbi:uncharacterized protein HD556DRAFT_1478862 [Suillus plorans]|uniref:Uncharacterized protein n=1 Tax=Suillus plorans TaxID=116603 RepID=A0A9P7DWU3_9AGAM|nr:uncharacterized protein HD556DRAFT_1478862 [Suillus plorans]KAG1805099.1 hypothetical protein HD556DRAFT_1478862 [Suillus plorans]
MYFHVLVHSAQVIFRISVFWGMHIVALNSVKSAVEMLDKKSSIYSNRQYLQYGEHFRSFRKNCHCIFGSRTALVAYHPIDEMETCRFLKRVLAKLDRLQALSVGTPTKTIYDDEELPTPTVSIANVARLPALMGFGLPTGAMLPHMRNKSQTAVTIGDALNATPVNAPTQCQEEHPSMATKTNSGESNNSDPDQPKKRHWYNIRRNRRHSEGD